MTQSLSDLCNVASLQDCLPYRSFDPETQIFVNRASKGFVIETLPIVGCGDEKPRQLRGLFQHSLPFGSNLQCLLIASDRIGAKLNTWVEARTGHFDILEELANERRAYLGDKESVRTFRLILSYSEPNAVFTSFDALLSLREQIITTLKGWGLPVKIWGAEDLLSGVDELLNPSDELNTLPIPWNIHDPLANQFMSPSSRWKIEPSQMTFGEHERIMRLYTPRLFPPVWYLNGMGTLIGDPFDEFLRFKGSFFLSYSIHICNEKTLKSRMLAKCGNVEKQAASPIAKYVPSLRKEAEERTFVREKFEEGQRLVRTRFQVGLLSPPELIEREQQTLFNLYRSQRWELALDRYLQLPAFLSCLPMTWGEGAADDSKLFQKTKTTLSHEPLSCPPISGPAIAS